MPLIQNSFNKNILIPEPNYAMFQGAPYSNTINVKFNVSFEASLHFYSLSYYIESTLDNRSKILNSK